MRRHFHCDVQLLLTAFFNNISIPHVETEEQVELLEWVSQQETTNPANVNKAKKWPYCLGNRWAIIERLQAGGPKLRWFVSLLLVVASVHFLSLFTETNPASSFGVLWLRCYMIFILFTKIVFEWIWLDDFHSCRESSLALFNSPLCLPAGLWLLRYHSLILWLYFLLLRKHLLLLSIYSS